MEIDGTAAKQQALAGTSEGEPNKRKAVQEVICNLERSMIALSYRLQKRRAKLVEEEALFQTLWKEKDALERSLIPIKVCRCARPKERPMDMDELAAYLVAKTPEEQIAHLVRLGLLTKKEGKSLLAGRDPGRKSSEVSP